MEDPDHLNELYRRIMHGSARAGEKERLAHWMVGLDVKRDDISPDEMEAEQQKSRDELRERFLPAQQRSGFIRPWMIAASVIMMFSVALLFFTFSRNQQSGTIYSETGTRAGERKQVTLTDGTVITLNSTSRLRYPSTLNNNTREVFLDGQAFFEVSHDGSRPFIVHAGKLAIQVLGTSFDVRNYREDINAAVTVATGKVSVKSPEITGRHLLTPGEQLTVNKRTGLAEEHAVEPGDFLAWQKGGQVFRSRELGEVCRVLERTYGITIIIRSPELAGQKMNLRTHGNENIRGVIDMLSKTGGFHYHIKERTITLWK
ncbi:FecR family protein [Pararcticibacter amylolyticus]|nr:FecR domain-containing protein [Pararcticibacter amylolyticus]